MSGTLSRMTFSCRVLGYSGHGDEKIAALEKLATREMYSSTDLRYQCTHEARSGLYCACSTPHLLRSVCGLITECSHTDDDRQERGNIYQRMRLTAIPYMYQSSPHHKLPGGCISASGGLFTESENNRFKCIIPVAYVTILDFGMMNGLVTLISVACSRLVRRYGR